MEAYLSNTDSSHHRTFTPLSGVNRLFLKYREILIIKSSLMRVSCWHAYYIN